MSSPDFSPIVNEICKRIENRHEREETAEELQGHLEDTYERNIATGKSEEDAYNAAIEVLGDRLALQQRLSAVHARSPASRMKQALWILVFSFILSKFISGLFSGSLGGVRMLVNFLGSICIFTSLLLLRNANVKLKRSFILCSASLCTDIIIKCINGFGTGNECINMFSVAADGILSAVMWWLAISGLTEMYRTFCGENKKKKPHLAFALIYLPAEKLLTAAAYIFTYGDGFNLNGWIFVAIFIAIYIFIIVQLVRLKNCLWDAETVYGIETWNRKNITVAAVAVAASFILPMCFMAGYAVKDTPKTEFILHDTQRQEEAEMIREQMLEMGMDKDILDMIPDSEIMNYSGATALETEKPAFIGSYLDSAKIYNFYFFDEDTEQCKLRSIFVANTSGCNYRVGMYYRCDDNFNHLCPTAEKEVYVSILKKDGATLYEKEPLNCDFSDFYNLVTTGSFVGGFDFRGEKDQTVIVALSYDVWNYRENFSPKHGFQFVNQRIPFTDSYSTVKGCAESANDYSTHYGSPTMETYFFRDTGMFSPDIIGQDYYTAEEYETYAE